MIEIAAQLREDIEITKLQDDYLQELDRICEIINKISMASKEELKFKRKSV